MPIRDRPGLGYLIGSLCVGIFDLSSIYYLFGTREGYRHIAAPNRTEGSTKGAFLERSGEMPSANRTGEFAVIGNDALNLRSAVWKSRFAVGFVLGNLSITTPILQGGRVTAVPFHSPSF